MVVGQTGICIAFGDNANLSQGAKFDAEQGWLFWTDTTR
jgi:hypothetical protein